MNRKLWNRVAGATAAIAVVAVLVAAGHERPAVAAADSHGLPNQWRWRLNRVPVVSTHAHVQVALRHQLVPLRGQLSLGTRQVPVLPGDAEEQILVVETLPAGASLEGIVAFDVLDFRQLGLAMPTNTAPLHVRASLHSGFSTASRIVPLSGHTIRNFPVNHADGWSNGEYNLLTLTSVEPSAVHFYTLYLAVRPVYH